MGTSIKFYAVISLFLYPGLNNSLVSTILCESYDDLRVLRADRSLRCGEEPICLATAGIFIPLYTICFPVGLLVWMRFGFTEAGRAQLLAWNKRYFVVAELRRGKHRLVKHPTKERAEKHLEEAKEKTEKPQPPRPLRRSGSFTWIFGEDGVPLDAVLVPDHDRLLELELEIYKARFGFFTDKYEAWFWYTSSYICCAIFAPLDHSDRARFACRWYEAMLETPAQ